jgi:type IV pilus assembly protein PilV
VNQKGFSLVEVLVAMSIFAVGILGAAQMQIVSMSTNTKAAIITEGAIVAQTKIEELLMLGYDAAALTDGDADAAAGLNDATAATADGSDVAANPNYTIFWNVQPNLPYTDTKTVRVIVRWAEKGVEADYSVDFVKSKGA